MKSQNNKNTSYIAYIYGYGGYNVIMNCFFSKDWRVSNQNQPDISNDAELSWEPPVKSAQASLEGTNQLDYPGSQDLQFHYRVFITLYEHFITVLLSIITSYNDKQI